jgi:hypothetical protein
MDEAFGVLVALGAFALVFWFGRRVFVSLFGLNKKPWERRDWDWRP